MQPNFACDACDEVRDLLLAHPSVGNASVFAEEQLAGQRYLIAYVKPSDTWTDGIKLQTERMDREKRVAQWQRVFDRTYYARGGGKPDFVGWTDSYTNTSIPENEMQEWLDATTQRITVLRPKHLLEIGCGVGLLTQALAPRCGTYCGTDFSHIAISRLRQFIDTQPQLSHVKLTECEATNFDDIRPESLDTVVLNSVVQYFPNLNYFLDVLRSAARSVVPGGHIFVGDVRHFGLLNILHGSVQFAKVSPDASVWWLKRRVALAVEQESELAIDPRFFLALSQRDLPITDVEILIKRGNARNELTRYRYDVILHVGERKSGPSEQGTGWSAGNARLNDLLLRFAKHKSPITRITNVANRRLSRDLAVTKALDLAGEKQPMRDIMQHIDNFKEVGIDPEAVWQSESLRGYDVSVGWSAGSLNGSFDITLTDRERCSDLMPGSRATTKTLDFVSIPLSTNPLAVSQMNKLSLELGDMLRTRLPEALLPASVIVTNKNLESLSKGNFAPCT